MLLLNLYSTTRQISLLDSCALRTLTLKSLSSANSRRVASSRVTFLVHIRFMHKEISNATIRRINRIINKDNILYKKYNFYDKSLTESLNTLQLLHKTNTCFMKTLRYLSYNNNILDAKLGTLTTKEYFTLPLNNVFQNINHNNNNIQKYDHNSFIAQLNNPSETFLTTLYNARLNFNYPSILPMEQQISGLIPPNKTLLNTLNNPDTEESRSIINYITLNILKALYLFKDKALLEREFLGRIPDYLGAIDVPMPPCLEKHFGPVALLQHCFNIVTAYKTFNKKLITQLFNNVINVDHLSENIPAQNFIESAIFYMNNFGDFAQQNNVIIYAVDPDSPEKIPHYNRTLCIQACDQPNVDFLAVGSMNNLFKPHDIKTGGLRALTHSRITVVHHSNTWSVTKIKNFISDHINQLNNRLKFMLEGPEKTAYIQLKELFLTEREKLRENNKQECLIQINKIKKNIMYDTKYNGLYPSICIDAGMSTFNHYIIENALEEKIINDPEKLDITIIFPKNTINIIETSNVLKNLTKYYFSGDTQRTILENLDRFGITVFTIEK